MLPIYHVEAGRTVVHALPVVVAVGAVLAIAYRYYSAFLAAKVAALDDARVTPAERLADGQNYYPTSKWVLFGHHFAAISGAGPLIGPVLALQYGYLPGLVWLVVGVCLAGAVQDMLVMAASVRRDGKSLAAIARRELGKPAMVVVSLAILVILSIALAGLGFVVVKALGGEEAKLPPGMELHLPGGHAVSTDAPELVKLPPGCRVRYAAGEPLVRRSEGFQVRTPGPVAAVEGVLTLPAGCVQVIAGSSWGAFTIACTIPIALLTGLWMYRIRPGHTTEASVVGAGLVLAATVGGSLIPGSILEPWFSLTQTETLIALCVYGFFAAVLPVWLLLGPRDYLSSFLKIGTVGLLIVSVCVANPPLQAPAINETFRDGGPTFEGGLFPFVFICVMCGAVSGFHALVASGTTPKMLSRESHIRTIGYGAMLVECVVAVTALIAAACLPPSLYYDINVAVDKVPKYQAQVAEISARYDPLHAAGADSVAHLDLGSVEERVGGESLRGRTGGAVTLAVGMSVVFDTAFATVGLSGDGVMAYWYHFAIMFEALFILTTIDAGTRIGRFLLQETAGHISPKLGRPDWLPGSLVASGLFTLSWGWLIHTGNIGTIWSMFGIANQLLAVLALTLVTTWLVNTGKGKYIAVTLVPMLWVLTTTLTAGAELLFVRFPGEYASKPVVAARNMVLTAFVLVMVLSVVMWAAARWLAVLGGFVPVRDDNPGRGSGLSEPRA